MKYIHVVGVLLLLTGNITTSHAQWNIVFSDTVNHEIYDIEFLNPDTGYAVGTIDENNSFVLKTLDGGQTWDTLFFPAMKFRSIDFPNADTGYISVLYGTLSIMRTVDHGASWQMICTGITPVPNFPWNPTGPVPILTTLEFVDGLRGIVTLIGTPYYTSDGGFTWSYCTIHTDHPSYPGATVDDGVYAWAGGHKVTYSTDSLNTFSTSQINNPYALYEATGIDFSSDSIFYVTLNGTSPLVATYWFGVISKSNNLASSWTDYHFTEIAQMGELEITPNYLYAVAYPAQMIPSDVFFIKSVDAGNTWYQQYHDTSFSMPVSKLKFLSCLNDSICYAAGEGTIFKTSNGGGPLLQQVGFQYTGMENTLTENSFSMYPNPTSTTFTISANTQDVYKVEIHNSLGQLISIAEFTQQTEINARHWQPGMYLIQVSNNQHTCIKKVIKN